MQDPETAQLAPESSSGDTEVAQVQELTNGEAHDNGEAQPAEAAPEGAILDINDPRLNEQVEDYDPTADANLFIPVPDGAHRANVGFQDKPGQSYFIGNILYALLEFTVDTPGEDGDGQTVRGFAWSKVDPKTGTSSLYDLCNKLGYPLVDAEGKAIKTLRDIKLHVDSVIGGHPPIIIMTQWRGNCRSCNETWRADHADEFTDEKDGRKKGDKAISKKSYLNGQSKWPQQTLDGSPFDGHYPMMVCKECGAGDPGAGGDPIRAQAEVSRWAKVPVQQ